VGYIGKRKVTTNFGRKLILASQEMKTQWAGVEVRQVGKEKVKKRSGARGGGGKGPPKCLDVDVRFAREEN